MNVTDAYGVNHTAREKERMTDRKMMWTSVAVGSTLGGLVPGLWHGSMFSLWGLFFTTLGGLAGVWAGWKVTRG